jgi:hypothetical protein
MQYKTVLIAFMMASGLALADCESLIQKTRDEIHENKQDYSLVSRNKALAYLMKADVKHINANPLPDFECRKLVHKAKSELRHGKK